MSKNVTLVSPDTTLQEAAKKMASIDSGFLPIGKDDKLQGTITDRDIVIKSVAKGSDPKTAKVQEAMTKDLIYCFEDQDINEVKKTMGEKQIRRMPVLNRDKRLVGVVALADLTKHTNLDETLSKVSENSGQSHKSSGAETTDRSRRASARKHRGASAPRPVRTEVRAWWGVGRFGQPKGSP